MGFFYEIVRKKISALV